MRQDYDEMLVRRYPNLYRDRYAGMQQTCMCWGFDCGDGWFHVIDEASKKLEAEILKLPKEDRQYCCASQVKEKYGTLRLYMTGSTSRMERIISKASRKSAKTCETCGSRGTLRINGGWYFTACKEHSEGCLSAYSRWYRIKWYVRSKIWQIKDWLRQSRLR